MNYNIIVNIEVSVGDLNAANSVDLYRGGLAVTVAIYKLRCIFAYSVWQNRKTQVDFATIVVFCAFMLS